MNHKLKIFPLAISAVTVLAMPLSVLAHEHQMFTIGGNDYAFTVGSLNEPVAVDDKTGVDLRVEEVSGTMQHQGETGIGQEETNPVIGLEKTLKVEISAGMAKRVLDLSPAFGEPGAYRAPFYPTVPTTLTYRFLGTINEVAVDLSFTCNPAGHPVTPEDKNSVRMSEGVTRTLKRGAFGCPSPKSSLGFPEQSASTYEVVGAVRDLQKQDASLLWLVSMSLLMSAVGLGVGVVLILSRRM